MTQQAQWDSSLAFIFAMIGAAVGLGNIWRFSYVLYSNGGGSFFIPYFVAIALMGIPFLILEYGVGFTFKESFSKIMSATPLNKWASEEEVSEWVYFLTMVNKSMSGQDILIDNGEYNLNSTFVWPNTK